MATIPIEIKSSTVSKGIETCGAVVPTSKFSEDCKAASIEVERLDPRMGCRLEDIKKKNEVMAADDGTTRYGHFYNPSMPTKSVKLSCQLALKGDEPMRNSPSIMVNGKEVVTWKGLVIVVKASKRSRKKLI